MRGDDYLIEDGTLIGYFGTDQEAIIPSGVTKIGKNAFRNRKIEKVIIPDSVTAIEKSAFSNCQTLSGELKLPENLEIIGPNAFERCTGITGFLRIPDSVKQIGDSAFGYCSGLNGKFTLPANLNELNYIFPGYPSIEELEVRGKMTEFSLSRLGNLPKLKTLILRIQPVPKMTDYLDASNLTTVDLPYEAFGEYMAALSGDKFRSKVRYISSDRPDGSSDMIIDGNGTLIGYLGEGVEIVIPDNVRKIGPNVFRNNTQIKKVYLPEGLIEIGDYAFANCTSLEEADLPDSVQTIGDSAFRECTCLKSVVLPEHLETIGEYAFYQDAQLTGGLSASTNVKSIGQCAFRNCRGLNGSLLVGAQVIGTDAFAYCSGFTSLTLLEGVREIGNSSFYSCKGMKGDLIIPDGVTKIGISAFSTCSGFDGRIQLPDTVSTIGSSAFSSCTGLTGDLIIPANLTELADSSFNNMRSIERVIVPDKITQLGSSSGQVLSDMRAVKEIIFMSDVPPVIRANEFVNLISLEKVFVPSSSLEDYRQAYSGRLNADVQFLTDTLVLPVSALRVDELYSRSAKLSWKPHSSAGVSQYRISVNDGEPETVTETGYTLQNLEEGTAYKATVWGVTESGEETGKTSVTFTSQRMNIREIKTKLGNGQISVGSNSLFAVLENSDHINTSQLAQLHGQFYYRKDGEEILIGDAVFNPSMDTATQIHMETKWDISQIENGEYEVIFRLTDPDGTQSELSRTVTVDRSIPSQISGISAIPDVNRIVVSWRMAKEANVTSYRIYRRTGENGSFYIIGRAEGRETLSFADTNVGKTEKYYYYVTAMNGVKEESIPSETVMATLNTDEEPPVMIRMLPKNGTYISGQVQVEMAAEDNIGISRIEAEISTDNRQTWQSIGQISSGQTSIVLDTTEYQDGLIYLRGTAFDEAGNASDPMVYAYSIDNTGPGKPAGLSYEATSITITLHWDDLSDQDLSHYVLQQKNENGEFETIQDHIQTVGANIRNLKPDSEYTFRVLGVDLNGNEGSWSDELICRTAADSTSPVITKIRPLSGSFNKTIDLNIQAEDEYCVKSIILQTSTDALHWNEQTVQNYVDRRAARTWQYSLNLDPFEEGSLYVRAIAQDEAGNSSDSSSAAPYVEYRIDRTAPAAPAGIQAQAQNGAVEISWDQGSETDLYEYSVYRSEQEDGEYALIAEHLSSLNYLDRTAEPEVTYFYKVAVTDKAGNLSALSQTVSAQVDPDTQAPVIISAAPQSGERLGAGYRKLRVLASDNRVVARMILYTSTDGVTYTEASRTTGKNTPRELFETDLPIDDFSDGSTFYARIQVEDLAGYVSEPLDLNFAIDKSAPVVISAQGSFSEDHVLIRWQSGQEQDLGGYRIYRKLADASDSSYKLVGQKKADGSLDYTFEDFSIGEQAADYVYKIEASDDCGNTATGITEVIHVPDLATGGKPVPVLNCESVMEVGVEYYIDASLSTDDSRIVSWNIDFGDGSSSNESKPIHVYSQAGTYTITLTVTDDEGNSSVLTREIEVREQNTMGTARIRVIDENNIAVPNAPVYFDLGEETQIVRKTDRDGYVTFSAEAGRHMVGCLIANNEWLPAKREMIVTPGTETSIYLRLVHYPMLEGHFEVTRMTFDEIQAAGIDLSDPENQHMLQVSVHLTYGKEEINTSFIYNETTGISIGRPCVITVGSESRKTTCYGYKIVKPDDPEQYEMAVAILDTPVEATCLKEFFDVKLHIINNAASDFVMENNTVTLHVPDGLTLLQAEGYSPSAAVQVPSIPGQSQKTISWMLRGDRVGEYDLSADFVGTIGLFNQSISMEFASPDKIQVYGLSDLKLTALVNKTIENDTFYFDLALSNNGQADINMPSLHITDDILSAFLEWKETDADGNETDASKTRDVRITQLNVLQENSQGAEVSLGKDGSVQTLAPGETLKVQYAAYHVAGYKNDFILKDAIERIASGYGLNFEIIEEEIVRDSLENAQEKVQSIWTDSAKKSSLEALLDDYSFMYVREALEWKEKYLYLDPAAIYEPAYEQMNLDQVFGDINSQALCREWIRLLQVDSSWNEAIENSISQNRETLLKTAAGTLADWMKEQNLIDETGLAQAKTKLESTGSVRLLASAFFDNGLDVFVKELFGSVEMSEEQKAALEKKLNTELASGLNAMVPEYSGLFSNTKTWKNSETFSDLLLKVLEIRAARQITKQIPDLFVQGLPENVNLKRIVSSTSDLQSEWWNAKQNSILTFWNASENTEGTDSAATAIALLEKEFDFSDSLLKQNAKELYGSAFDDFNGYDPYLTSTLILQTATVLSMSLSTQLRAVNPDEPTAEQSQQTLVLLRNLIRMRIVAERAFSTYAERAFMDYVYMNLLNRVNNIRSAEYPSFNAYYTDRLAELMACKDELFSAPQTSLQRPEAPAVEIDYEKEQTRQSFGAEYEYSFNQKDWTSCDGSPVALHPGQIQKTLWVRKKATESALSGNVARLRIPARDHLFSDPIISFDGETYELSGLPAGSYQFGFANTKEDLVLNQTMTLEEGDVHLFKSTEYWLFLAVQKEGTADSFDSVTKVIAVTIPDSWVLDDETMRARGIPANTSHAEVIEHYSKRHQEVQLTDKDGNETDVAATGSVLHVNDKDYTVVITGDVSGDGDVNLIDCSQTSQYILGSQALENEYFEAGQVTENEDISILDLNAMAKYTLTGSFE